MYRIDKHPTIKQLKVVKIPATKLAGVSRDLRTRITINEDSEFVGATAAECQDMLERGALNQVKRAREFAEKVSRTVKVETPRRRKRNVVAGGRVRVSAYLAGSQKPFSRKVKVVDAKAPVRVYVDIGCSGGVDAKDVEKRGLALLAFAHCLSKQRPVEVIAFTYFRIRRQDVLVKVPLGLKPVNWALAGAVIGHSAFMRDFAFRITHDVAKAPKAGCIAWGESYQGNTVAREILGAGPNDIVFGRGHLSDSVLRSDPVKWVASELDRVLNTKGN